MDGFGKLTYPDGNLAYEGEWKNNAFNGRGKVFNEDPMELSKPFDYHNFDYLQDNWDKYEGEFVNDFKEGLGTLSLVNGERYVGEFKQDMVHGQGKYHTMESEVVNGVWELNKFIK